MLRRSCTKFQSHYKRRTIAPWDTKNSRIVVAISASTLLSAVPNPSTGEKRFAQEFKGSLTEVTVAPSTLLYKGPVASQEEKQGTGSGSVTHCGDDENDTIAEGPPEELCWVAPSTHGGHRLRVVDCAWGFRVLGF